MTDESCSTREKILHLLRRNGPLTAQELGRELGISVSGVRQHAAVLERNYLIRSRPRKQKLGRPGYEYVLSPASEDVFPKVYKEMALALLNAARDIGGDKLISKLITHRRAQTFADYSDMLRNVPEWEKLARIAECQNERGHLAHLERSDHSQRLIQFNCPVHELSACHPEFCESERKMYERLLGQPVKLEQCRAQGAEYCCFSTSLPAT